MVVTHSGQDLTMEWLQWKGNPEKAKIVLISGDEEYRSEETLVQLAKILNVNHGFNCTVLFAQNPNCPGIVNPNYQNNIPGLVALADADLMIILTRFRALPDLQMRYIDDYLKSGKPVLGMRTATHAFKYDTSTIKSSFAHYGNYYKENNVWQGGFGKLILGEGNLDIGEGKLKIPKTFSSIWQFLRLVFPTRLVACLVACVRTDF